MVIVKIAAQQIATGKNRKKKLKTRFKYKMIKLFSLKQQKKDGTEGSSKSGMGQKKASAAQLRITKGKSWV